MTELPETRQIEYLPLDDLAVDPRNPKAHDTGTITASIDRFGVVEAIVRDDRTGYIVSGHGRRSTLRAMQERGDLPPDGVRAEGGHWYVPVVTGWASRSDTEARAALIALNRTTELGGWVDDELVDLLGELAEQPDGLEGVGFYPEDLDQLRLRLDDYAEDATPEISEAPTAPATDNTCPKCGYDVAADPEALRNG